MCQNQLYGSRIWSATLPRFTIVSRYYMTELSPNICISTFHVWWWDTTTLIFEYWKRVSIFTRHEARIALFDFHQGHGSTTSELPHAHMEPPLYQLILVLLGPNQVPSCHRATETQGDQAKEPCYLSYRTGTTQDCDDHLREKRPLFFLHAHRSRAIPIRYDRTTSLFPYLSLLTPHDSI